MADEISRQISRIISGQMSMAPIVHYSDLEGGYS